MDYGSLCGKQETVFGKQRTSLIGTNGGATIGIVSVVVVDIATGVHIPRIVRIVAISATQTHVLRIQPTSILSKLARRISLDISVRPTFDTRFYRAYFTTPITNTLEFKMKSLLCNLYERE